MNEPTDERPVLPEPPPHQPVPRTPPPIPFTHWKARQSTRLRLQLAAFHQWLLRTDALDPPRPLAEWDAAFMAFRERPSR